MDVKKAVQIARNGKKYTWLEVMESASVVQQALADGYTLCRVEDAIEKIEQHKALHLTPFGTPIEVVTIKTVKEILKEACE